MSLTTRRPKLEAGGMPYAYLDGKFYFDDDGTHADMIPALKDLGFTPDEMKEGVWGWVYNFGEPEDPIYQYDIYSDFMPDALGGDEDFFDKLDSYFPGIELHNIPVPRRIIQTSGWWFDARTAILHTMSANIDSINDFISNDEAANTAIQALTSAGGTVHVVGGAVRDAVLGQPPKDVDLMCSGLTEDQISAALSPLGGLTYAGKAFGVFRFKKGQDEVEIALPRTEYSTGPGHQDFEVKTDPFLSTEEDLQRRDFTVNAMGYDPMNQTLVDPYGGVEDANNGRLRLVNDQAFHDDPLRIVRALVANARYGLEPDDQMLAAMSDQAQAIRHLPGERIQMEMDKLLSAADPVRAMQIAEKTGLLDYLAPELAASVGFNQNNPHHDLDVWQHTMKVLQTMSQISNDPDLRLAALFHDSGKPESYWEDPNAPEGGGGHFYKKYMDNGETIGQNHEEVGADLAAAFMNRLRYPNARKARVITLIQNHMFPYFNTERGARKFLNSLGGDVQMAQDLLKIRMSDASGKSTQAMSEYDRHALENAYGLLDQVIEKDQAFTVKDLAVNGHDMMNLGLKGKQIGEALSKLLELVIDEPELNTRDQLMQIAQDL